MKLHSMVTGMLGAGVAAFTWATASFAQSNTTVATAAAPASEAKAETYTGPNRGLIGTGLVTFGLSYIPAVIVAGTSGISSDHHLYVPVIGPWLDLGDRPGCGPGSVACDSETTNKVLVVVDGVFQGIGALTTVAGFLSPERVVVTKTAKSTSPERLTLHLTPARFGRPAMEWPLSESSESNVESNSLRRAGRERDVAHRELYIGGVHSSELDRLYVDHVAELEGHYAALLTAHGWDGVVIHSGAPVLRSQFDDQHWPLRPVPHWQHWSPLAEADCALVVRAGQRPKLLRKTSSTFWERPPPLESNACLEPFDVIAIDRLADVKEHIGRGRVAFVGQEPAAAAAWDLLAEVRPSALMGALDALRTTKTPYEVACIAEANARASVGHDALREGFCGEPASELELHLSYLRATAQDDWEAPYKNIVALGANAATLHHVAYGRRASQRNDESLLVDAGATCRGYCADITRTWVKGKGAAASAFAQLIAGVDAMQQRLCAAVRVGIPYEHLHDDSHRQVAGILREVGLVRASADEAVANGITRAFYPHGLGHSLGLQTHDVGCALRAPRADNPFLRNTTDVTAGQVLTVEPGIYFIEELLGPLRTGDRRTQVDWRAVEALAPLGGVRVEDDLHVSGGATARNLTREHLPLGGGIAG